jgi:uncharacterized protein (TIGR00369 family)
LEASRLDAELQDRASPVTKWLGMKIVSHDPETLTMRIAFDPRPEAANIAGNVQGGIVVAMLDNAMGYNSFYSLGMANQQASIDIHTHFFNPVPMGRVEVEAKVVKTGRSVVFVEGWLYDMDGRLAARAVSTTKIRPLASPAANTNKS